MTGVVAVVASTTWVLNYVAQKVLEINWRQGMTDHLVGTWMRGHAPYRIERHRTVDNADQRIAEDARMFWDMSLRLLLGFFGMMVSFVIFSRILWQNAGELMVPFGSLGTLVIPGYLFVVAFGWGLFQTWLTHLAGHRIAGITVAQQKAEADFRFGLATARESAEQVAFYRGDAVERSRFGQIFIPIRVNWFQLLTENVKLSFVNQSFGLISSVVPYLASAPKVMSGEMTIGTMMQNSMAFSMVLLGVSWIALVYPQLVVYSAVIQRLSGLRAATGDADPPGIEKRGTEAPVLATEGLQIGLPDGTPAAWVDDVEIRPGSGCCCAAPPAPARARCSGQSPGCSRTAAARSWSRRECG